MTSSLARFQRQLLSWYRAHRRALPWRADGVTPYHVMVSEAMLQQTQVATVVPYFLRFISRFETVQDLANAAEQDVLRLWQGLGYYSRARNLQGAARMIVERYGGEVPRTVDELLALPGVGRYTAGAIASIAYDTRAPILDGNVMRVLCRIDRIETDPRQRQTQEELWKRAEQVLPTEQVGDFNSALMELGATICTPRAPACLMCPVRAHCEAQAAGVQESIPPVRAMKMTPLHRRRVFVIEHRGRFLMEQRPARGRWAGMWQFITVEAGDKPTDDAQVAALAGVAVRGTHELGEVKHALTHRRYAFEVLRARAVSAQVAQRNGHAPQWMTLDEIDRVPLPRPHLKIIALLRASAADRGK